MPRGRKKAPNLTLEEQLMEVQTEIEKQSEELKALKAKKKSIEGKLAEKEKEDVYRAFLQSGKTVEDLKALLFEGQVVTKTEGE